MAPLSRTANHRRPMNGNSMKSPATPVRDRSIERLFFPEMADSPPDAPAGFNPSTTETQTEANDATFQDIKVASDDAGLGLPEAELVSGASEFGDSDISNSVPAVIELSARLTVTSSEGCGRPDESGDHVIIKTTEGNGSHYYPVSSVLTIPTQPHSRTPTTTSSSLPTVTDRWGPSAAQGKPIPPVPLLRTPLPAL
jgi:hypothetical protein